MGHFVQPTWPHEKSVSLATPSTKNHHAPWPTPLSSRPVVKIANRLRFGAYKEGAMLAECKGSAGHTLIVTHILVVCAWSGQSGLGKKKGT